MAIQRVFKFGEVKCSSRRRYVEYSQRDLEYLDQCRKKDREPTESFLIESRAKRLGCTERDLRCMLRYELNRELADELSIVFQPDGEYLPPAWIDWELIDAVAIRKAHERSEAFQRFLLNESV